MHLGMGMCLRQVQVQTQRMQLEQRLEAHLEQQQVQRDRRPEIRDESTHGFVALGFELWALGRGGASYFFCASTSAINSSRPRA